MPVVLELDAQYESLLLSFLLIDFLILYSYACSWMLEGDDVPDFEALVRFLVTPFLESPDALRLDFESLSGGQRLWIRVAFDGEDKGRVFGRGGS